MVMLCLYARVQVNILGRHLYLEIARGSEGSHSLDEAESADSFSKHGQQDFLATAEYLPTYGIKTLIMNMQSAAIEVLKGMVQLRETTLQIFDLFMSIGAPNYWISYLVPESATEYRQLIAMSSIGSDDSSVLMDSRKLELLMSETWAVLSSPDFVGIVEITLRKVVDVLVEDVGKHFGGVGPS